MQTIKESQHTSIDAAAPEKKLSIPVRVKSKMKVHTPNPEKELKVDPTPNRFVKKRDSSNIKTLDGKRFSSINLNMSKKSIGASPSQAQLNGDSYNKPEGIKAKENFLKMLDDHKKISAEERSQLFKPNDFMMGL